MKPQTGAELLVESLVAAGVRHLFTLSGNQILPIYDATIGRAIQLIHTRHEAAAVHMADAWGRLTEDPGVVLLTAGPGHCNAISALYVARMAESPVVLLSGHSPLAQLGRGAFQEMDQVAVAAPVTKAAWLVERADRLDEDIAEALSMARTGRPGPVHLSLPVDVLQAPLSTSDTATPSDSSVERRLDAASGSPGPGLRLSDEAVDEIIDLLGTAERPLILSGPAMARAARWSDIARLSEITGIPALPMESPRGVNDPWLHGATNSLAKADVVLLVGKRSDFSLRFGKPPFFAETCRFIQIDAEPDQLSKEGPIRLAVVADPSQAIHQLTAAAEGRTWPDGGWRAEVLAARHEVPHEWQTHRRSSQQPIHPLRVCEALQPFLDDGAVMISDGGEFGQWMQAGLEAQRRLINGPSGAIGSAVPLALAAKLVYPDRPAFAFSGDGAFGYHVAEFDTALRFKLPIVAIVGNDARWNAEVQLQIRNYGADRTVGCGLLPTRYDRVVEALGGHGEHVEDPDDLVPAVQRSLASGLPACINVMIEGVGAPSFRS